MYRAAFAFLFLAAPSFAADKPSDREVTFKKITEHEFDDVNVKGAVNGPAIQYVNVRQSTDFKALLRLRTDFDSEMKNSASEVQ